MRPGEPPFAKRAAIPHAQEAQRRIETENLLREIDPAFTMPTPADNRPQAAAKLATAADVLQNFDDMNLCL